jgi:hypothetical protein
LLMLMGHIKIELNFNLYCHHSKLRLKSLLFFAIVFRFDASTGH